MSMWTHIHGTIKVFPIGRTQAEKTYILQTILDHLPRVTGSEEDMQVYVNKLNGTTTSDSSDEFGINTNLLERDNGWMRTQDYYMLTVQGDLRDREFTETYKEFLNWLCRLSKRCNVIDILVRIEGYDKFTVIDEHGYEHCFCDMFEDPSWCRDNREGEPAWAEYLMWMPMGQGMEFPAVLGYKYFNDDKNDKKVKNWIATQ